MKPVLPDKPKAPPAVGRDTKVFSVWPAWKERLRAGYSSYERALMLPYVLLNDDDCVEYFRRQFIVQDDDAEQMRELRQKLSQ